MHPTIERSHIKRRIERLNDVRNIDWATAESLAFGTLLTDGFNLRLSGQDVGRGTFSQRHCLLVDQVTNQTCIPLNSIVENQKNFLEVNKFIKLAYRRRIDFFLRTFGKKLGSVRFLKKLMCLLSWRTDACTLFVRLMPELNKNSFLISVFKTFFSRKFFNWCASKGLRCLTVKPRILWYDKK